MIARNNIDDYEILLPLFLSKSNRIDDLNLLKVSKLE